MTGVFSKSVLEKIISPKSIKILDELGIGLGTLAMFNTFFTDNNFIVPEEFTIYLNDVRYEYYLPYDDNNLENFIEFGVNIYNYLKTNCFYNSKKVMLIDENCKFENDSKLRGGHPCTSDEEWDMNTCVPYYCENGYVFNKNTKKCEIDPCYEEEDINTTSEKKMI